MQSARLSVSLRERMLMPGHYAGRLENYVFASARARARASDCRLMEFHSQMNLSRWCLIVFFFWYTCLYFFSEVSDFFYVDAIREFCFTKYEALKNCISLNLSLHEAFSYSARQTLICGIGLNWASGKTYESSELRFKVILTIPAGDTFNLIKRVHGYLKLLCSSISWSTILGMFWVWFG